MLARLEKNGVLRIERMNDTEYQTYLSLIQGSLSSRLDSGESASIAVAISRGYGIILDENKARRIFAALPNRTEYACTLQLFFSVAFNMAWPVEQLSYVVAEARRYARLGVPKDSQHLLASLAL